jgi:hypothetical protein
MQQAGYDTRVARQGCTLTILERKPIWGARSSIMDATSSYNWLLNSQVEARCSRSTKMSYRVDRLRRPEGLDEFGKARDARMQQHDPNLD